jgi:hypothetical protein
MLKDGQMLDFESPPAPAVHSIKKADLKGVIVDDSEAELTGFESEGHTTGGFVERGYRHDSDSLKGEQKAKFTPALPKAGNYSVAISYGALANRASNVPVTVLHADGESIVVVNQKKKPGGKDNFHPLGIFRFESGKSGYVQISNEGTNGHVIIDAVQFMAD